MNLGSNNIKRSKILNDEIFGEMRKTPKTAVYKENKIFFFIILEFLLR